MCTVKKNLKNNVFTLHILEKKRDIAKIVADLKSPRSDNVVVEVWRKSEIVDFFSCNKRD